MSAKLVFLDVDTQVDFMLPGGALYVPDAETIIPNLARLMEYARAHQLLVISSADAHAPADPSFTRWPPHCVVGTRGQQRIPETQHPSPMVVRNEPGFFRPPLPAAGQVVIEKIDYDVSSNPNFSAIVEALGPARFLAFGVATEYCVRASVLALRRRGFPVDLVTDAIRGITLEGSEKALAEMRQVGVRPLTMRDALAGRGR